MMAGSVNATLEPLLVLEVFEAQGATLDLEATVDTGFNGFLTLPATIIAALGLPWLIRLPGELADGSTTMFDVCDATVLWHGQPRNIEIEAAEAQPLIGMALLRGSELKILVEPNGTMTITPSP